MFRADVTLIDLASFVNGKLDDLLCTWRQANFAQDNAVTAPDDKFNCIAYSLWLDAHAFQYQICHAVADIEETQQDMFRPNIIVRETLRRYLSKAQRLFRMLVKFVESISVVHQLRSFFFCVLSAHVSTGLRR